MDEETFVVIAGATTDQVFVVPDWHPLATGIPAPIPQGILDVMAACDQASSADVKAKCTVTSVPAG